MPPAPTGVDALGVWASAVPAKIPAMARRSTLWSTCLSIEHVYGLRCQDAARCQNPTVGREDARTEAPPGDSQSPDRQSRPANGWHGRHLGGGPAWGAA